MFKKVLKYDMASIKRYWWLIAAAVLGISVVGSLVFRGVYLYFENVQNSPGQAEDVFLSLVMMAGMIFLFICVMAVFSSAFVTPVMTHLRYYRNFFTDEGYLTFTLPVSRKTLYLSKTVNSLLWTVAHALLLVVAVSITITLAPPAENGHVLNFVVWQGLGDALSAAWNAVGAWMLVYILEGILLLICSSAMSIGLIQLCITIGAVIAKKHKLLAAIGIYYAVNMATSTLYQIVFGCGSAFFVSSLAELLRGCTASEQNAAISLILLALILAVAALAMVLHFIALGLVERRLNLA